VSAPLIYALMMRMGAASTWAEFFIRAGLAAVVSLAVAIVLGIRNEDREALVLAPARSLAVALGRS
jgi:hypothetical protein